MSAEKYLIRVYYRGSDGRDVRYQTLYPRNREHALERLDGLGLGDGWRAHAVIARKGEFDETIGEVYGPRKG